MYSSWFCWYPAVIHGGLIRHMTLFQFPCMYKNWQCVWICGQFMNKFHEVVSRRYIIFYFSWMFSKYQLYSCPCYQLAGIFLCLVLVWRICPLLRWVLKSLRICVWELLYHFSSKIVFFYIGWIPCILGKYNQNYNVIFCDIIPLRNI